MCDSCTESDLESYTSVLPEDVGQHHRSLNEYENPQYYDIDPRSLSYRSSTDLNTSSSGSSSCDITNEIEGNSKPHKAHDAGWEAIRAIKLRDGTMGLNHFRILQRLGSGDIGTVYLAELRGTSCYFAMKVMDKKSLASRNKLLRAQTEREILEALDHPFLPTLYTYVNERHFSSLVMEFCPGGDLHVLRQRQPSKRFAENAVRFYAAEVLLALEYLHMMGIVYRDLKPENVLVREDGHIMLSDFDLSLKCNVNPILWRLASVRRPSSAGTSCNLPGFGCVAPCNVHPIASCLPFSLPRAFQLPGCALKPSPRTARGPLPELIVEPTNLRSMSFVGTHEYLAPEVILGDGHGSAVDWWTLGIFLFELLYGTTPFKGADNELTLTNIITQPLRFPSNQDEHYFVSPAAQHLVRGLLIKDPLKRLAALRGASEIKQQPFFQGINWALIRCAVPPEIPGPIGSFIDQGEPPFSHNDKKELNSIVDGSADSDLELF